MSQPLMPSTCRFLHSNVVHSPLWRDNMRFGIKTIQHRFILMQRRSMHLDQIVAGKKAHYRLIKALKYTNKVPTVFKAEVLQDERRLIPARYVIVKTVAQGDEASRDDLIREYNTYKVQSISSSEYIRNMYDVIGNLLELNNSESTRYPGIVFEWLDTTLQDLCPETYGRNLILLYAIAHAVLSSSAEFQSENLINTDIKPDNVLISDVATESPTVKIGDLGSVYNEGEVYESQPFAMRSPEVWRGLACQHRSEVWALAAMLLVWIKPEILGTPGITRYITPSMWSIAKLMQLFPGWKGPPSDEDFCRAVFKVAQMLSEARDPERPEQKRVNVASLEEEMAAMRLPIVLRNFLRSLLITEPEGRPSASEAMASDEHLALRQAAIACTGSDVS